MELLEHVIDKDKMDYKCYDILKMLINNPLFYENLKNGIESGKITGFTEDIWELIKEQNIRNIPSFEDVFRRGFNLGNCTNTAKQLSFSFPRVYICGGIQFFLVGTINSSDGSHTWMVSNGKIYDTSLMLIIDESFAKEFGYQEYNRYNPCESKLYNTTKDFTLDTSLNGHIKR